MTKGRRVEQLKQLIKRCQKSSMFFIENFCKVKHPTAGVIPFSLFNYQKQSLKDYRAYQYNIYRKNRQCGISTLTGAYALWYGMFFSHATILIVSKRDEDAKEFLRKNIKFVYEHLPEEFREIYGDPPETYNEHHIIFPNGSSIKSLTSSPDTLRSNSSSLNVLDEVAFMPDMEAMWAGGQQTLMHGGQVICISTTKGVGNWYHTTWEDAVAGRNEFHPIVINWWNMDWTISYRDKISGKVRQICPTAGLRKCETKEEINKWGPYWSPWLEEQYRALQMRGEAHLFRQEVLAEFIGTGNTVLSREQLVHVMENLSKKFWTVGIVDSYVHPATEENLPLDFEHQLQIWKKPVRPEPDVVENGRIIQPGQRGHTYSMGVDISSGEADDFSSIEIVDCDTLEQVAELNIMVQPSVLLMMIDYLGRYYNGAFVVPERAGLGIPVCQDLYHKMAYTNVFRMKTPAGKYSKKIGFPTNPVYKPQINKALLDNIGEEGVKINSQRLSEQLQIYVHLGQTASGGSKTGHVDGPGNHSDMVIGLGLALIGVMEAVQADQTTLLPKHSSHLEHASSEPIMVVSTAERMRDLMTRGGTQALVPMVVNTPMPGSVLTSEEEMMKFATQMGGIPIGSRLSNPAFKRSGKIDLKYKRHNR